MFQTLKRRGHPDGPPPTLSDGWGGNDEAMVEVYGLVPEYSGRGRPPTRKQARPGWQYLQMVKQRDEHGHLQGIKLRVIFGKKSELIKLLGQSTAYIERDHLTSRLFNGRQVRKTLAFSKEVENYGSPQLGKIVTITWCGPTKLYVYQFGTPLDENGSVVPQP